MYANDRKWGAGISGRQSVNAGNRGRSKAMRSETGALLGFLAVATTVLLVGFLILVGFLGLAVMAHAGTDTLPEAERGGPSALPLPESLNAFYPPAADRPIYLIRMLSLETSFSGIVVDLMEDDIDGARGSFGDFRRQYLEIAAMVPEWTGMYPEEKVKELGAALAAGDKGKAMDAFAAVGGICHRCHVAAMVPVQQKFHWGDFGATTVRDPLSGAATGYPQFKQHMAANLAGITVNLRQGQFDNARKQFEEFRSRFAALTDSCNGCHASGNRSFVDREVQETVGELGEAIRNRSVSGDSVVAFVQKIGRESCSKCHLVHLPAAYAGHSPR
jgi:hypothetical protein